LGHRQRPHRRRITLPVLAARRQQLSGRYARAPHRHALVNSYPNQHSDAHALTVAYASQLTVPLGYSDEHINSHGNVYGHANPDIYADEYCYLNAHFHSDWHEYATRYAHADPNADGELRQL
jgi:hypothetical protein